MREIFSFKGLDRKTIVFFGVLALFVVLGPFGTYEVFDVWERVVYWTLIMVGVGFFMHILVTIALSTPLLGPLNQFMRLIIGSILAGLPGGVVVIFIDQMMREMPLRPNDLPLIWGQVAVLGTAIAGIEYIDWRRPGAKEAPPIRTRFHQRLNPDLGQIISLSMQDHYVEVTCTEGTELILIRMSDAIAELEGLKGSQTHRSHWVARDAVVSVSRSGQKASVLLRDGRTLPVSATYADHVSALIPE